MAIPGSPTKYARASIHLHLALLFLFCAHTQSKWFTVDNLLDHARKCNNATHFSCPFHLTCCNKFTERCNEFESETADCIKIPLLHRGEGFKACCREIQNSRKVPSENNDVCEYLLSSWPDLREEICRDEVPLTTESLKQIPVTISVIHTPGKEKYKHLSQDEQKESRPESTFSNDCNCRVLAGVLGILFAVSGTCNVVLVVSWIIERQKKARKCRDQNNPEQGAPGSENDDNKRNSKREHQCDDGTTEHDQRHSAPNTNNQSELSEASCNILQNDFCPQNTKRPGDNRLESDQRLDPGVGGDEIAIDKELQISDPAGSAISTHRQQSIPACDSENDLSNPQRSSSVQSNSQEYGATGGSNNHPNNSSNGGSVNSPTQELLMNDGRGSRAVNTSDIEEDSEEEAPESIEKVKPLLPVQQGNRE